MFNQADQTVVAPLDEGQLKAAMAPFGSSRMLPKAAYVDREVLAWERLEIFGDWVCVGRTAEIGESYAAKAYSLGQFGVLVVRDGAGALRAFENSCRHRGHELLPCGDAASGRAIVCPYHAWTYDHDGSLRGAPGFKRLPGFDPSEFSLNAVPVRDWQGWLFVDPSGRGRDFDAHIGELEQIVEPYDAVSLRTAVTHEYEVAANWKVVVENYQECYHCSMIHPELCRVSPPTSGENIDRAGDWVGGWMELRAGAETMSLDGKSRGTVMARLDEQEQHTVMYVAVMPNLLLSLHPDYVMTHLLTPLAPDLTRIQCSWAFPPQTMQRDGFDPSYAVDFWDLTNRQDWAACESVQRGIMAPGYVPGPLAPEEDGVYQFVSMMARRYLGLPTTGA
jgi:Rieske 2Fe-2S family protein